MKDNPYSSLIKIIQSQGSKTNTPGIKIAKVTSVSDTNIIIEVDGLPIDKDNIYISDYLLRGYRRELKTDNISNLEKTDGIENLVGSTTSSNHSHGLQNLTINHGVFYTKDTLKINDLVAVIPVLDRQTYIILSKVVRYGQ